MTSAALIVGAATAVACGDSKDESQSAAADTTAAQAAPAATTPAPAAPASTQGQAAPPASDDPEAKAYELYKRYSAQGTVRLAAISLGTPGIVQVKPKGIKYHWDHYYPKGTVVTLKARDTKAARFIQWSGVCTGTKRTCTVKMDALYRTVAGFDYNAKGAKTLKSSSPLLKPGTTDGSPGASAG